VYGLIILRYHSRVQLVLLRFFFCSTLITLGVNIMLPRHPQIEHIVICVISQDSACYYWVFVKRNFVCESKFSWWLSRLRFGVSFCLNDFAISTCCWKSKMRRYVRKSLFRFKLVDSKSASAFDYRFSIDTDMLFIQECECRWMLVFGNVRCCLQEFKFGWMF
jgi:hypothetical protein